MLRDLRFVLAADGWILILVFDLIDGPLGPPVGFLLAIPTRDVLRVAAQPQSQVPGGNRAAIEMLVIHALGGGADRAVLPVHALTLFVALAPEQRVALAPDRDDVRAGVVAVTLLVSSGRKFGNVGHHRV